MTVPTVVVAGTGTEVGKTWLAAELARRLRGEGLAVSARKPVQSFDPDAGSTDADVLGAATGVPSRVVCPPHRSYPIPMAPPIAAEVLGMPPFTLSELMSEIDLPASGVTLVEGVGGPRSPVATDGDTVSLAEALDASLVILVAEPVLGTINATLLSAAAFGSCELIVYLNRFQPAQLLHRTNYEWLTTRAGLRVVTDVEQLAGEIRRLHEIAEAPA